MSEPTITSNRTVLEALSKEEQRKLYLENIRKVGNYKAREVYLRQRFMIEGLVKGNSYAMQKVHTPFPLCREMVNKLYEFIGTSPKGLKILVYNAEFLDILYQSGVLLDNEVWFVNENPLKVQWAKDIYQGDENDKFIVQNWLNWKTDMKFDVIVGNPPYQELNEEGKNWGGGRKLWEMFVLKSTELLKTGGYMCLIHPTTWRAFSDKALLRHVFHKNNPVHINLETAKKHFQGVGSRFDWYVLQKGKYTGNTTVESESGVFNIDITKWEVIPNGFSSKLASVFLKAWGCKDKLNFEKNQTHHSYRDHVSENKSKTFCHPIKHAIRNGDDDTVLWASKPHEVQNKEKILISRGGYLKPIYDKGEFGVSQDALYMLVDSEKEAKFLIRWFDSKLLKFLLKHTKFSAYHNHKCINTFPYPKDLSDNFTDADVYKHFNLTQDEIYLIEKSV